jgi:hypothetical protein
LQDDGFGAITFSIIGGNVHEDSDEGQGTFAIDPVTGFVSIAYLNEDYDEDLDRTTSLNLNFPYTYTLTIQVEDGGGLSATSNMVIEVTNANDMPALPDMTVDMPELTEPGSIILELPCDEVCDADDGDSIEMVILDCSLGTAEAPKCGSTRKSMFSITQIDSRTSALTLANNLYLDHEDVEFDEIENPVYILGIMMRDDGAPVPMSSVFYVEVSVTDDPEPPVSQTGAFTIWEDHTLGDFVGNMAELSFDQDADSVLTYSFADTSEHTDVFSVGETSGNITTLVELDYETENYYNLKMVVTDETGLTAQSDVFIQIRDVNEPPVISTDMAFDCAENLAIGGPIGTLLASDVDAADAFLSFSIVDGPAAEFFEIGGALGKTLSLKKLVDYEAQTSYELEVMVTDHGELTDTTTIPISIIDVNDLTVTAIGLLGDEESNLLATAGGEVVVVEGTNFGSLSDHESVLVGATFRNILDEISYAALDCSVFEAGVVIHCTTPPGIGHSHVWTISVTNDVGTVWDVVAPPGTSYKAPTLVSVIGGGALPTRGGGVVTIVGTDLSPLLPGEGGSEHDQKIGDSSVVVYGRSLDTSDEYACKDAKFMEPPEGSEYMYLTCETDEGVGSSLVWQVKVGMRPQNGMWSQESAKVELGDTAYAVPSIDTVSADTLSTRGDEKITITGENFGQSIYDVSASYGQGGDKYAAASCAVPAGGEHEKIVCSSVEGIGFGHRFKVVVGGQESEMSDDSEEATVSYLPPSILLDASVDSTAGAVSGPGLFGASTRGGQKLIVSGEHFGPSSNEPFPIVQYGDDCEEYVAASCTVAVPHTQISCLTVEGTGFDHPLQVEVGEQLSNV